MTTSEKQTETQQHLSTLEKQLLLENSSASFYLPVFHVIRGVQKRSCAKLCELSTEQNTPIIKNNTIN